MALSAINTVSVILISLSPEYMRGVPRNKRWKQSKFINCSFPLGISCSATNMLRDPNIRLLEIVILLAFSSVLIFSMG